MINLRPSLPVEKTTMPSTRAKRVWSLPMPTLRPGWWGVPPRHFIAETITAPGDSFNTSDFASSNASTAIGSYDDLLSQHDISRRSDSELSTINTLFIVNS